MKFGHYNLNSSASSTTHLTENQQSSCKDKSPTTSSSLFRLKKLRLQTPAFLSRFQRHIETFRRLNSRSESPISFRASLFDCGTTKRQTSSGSLDVKRARSSVPQSHQWNIIHQQLATTASISPPTYISTNQTQNHDEDNFYVFGAHTRKIGIKHPQPLLTGRNYAIPSNRPKYPTPPKPKLSTSKSSPTSQPNDSSLKDILDSSNQIGEDVEFKVLKDYFETTSYSEIVNDPDFKDYLSRKNYGDILDYLDANNEPEVSELSSLYKEPRYLQPRKMHKSKSTGNIYDSIGGAYNTYDYPDTWIPPKGPQPTPNRMCNSLRRIKQFFKNSEVRHDKTHRSHIEKYAEIKKFCQLLFDENHAFDEKVKSATIGKRFSEKKYHRLLDRFVKSKGFASVDEYVYTKFGSILDQTICSTLASNTAVKPEYSKNYKENIPKRYHVTKQQFLEADLTKNIFPMNGTLYSRSNKCISNANMSPSAWSWDTKDLKQSSMLSNQKLQFGDHCFTKRYSKPNRESVDFKYQTMCSVGVPRNKNEISTQDIKVNSETLPSHWPRRRHLREPRPKLNNQETQTNKRRHLQQRNKPNVILIFIYSDLTTFIDRIF